VCRNAVFLHILHAEAGELALGAAPGGAVFRLFFPDHLDLLGLVLVLLQEVLLHVLPGRFSKAAQQANVQVGSVLLHVVHAAFDQRQVERLGHPALVQAVGAIELSAAVVQILQMHLQHRHVRRFVPTLGHSAHVPVR
jgi:hypothetical protein